MQNLQLTTDIQHVTVPFISHVTPPCIPIFHYKHTHYTSGRTNQLYFSLSSSPKIKFSYSNRSMAQIQPRHDPQKQQLSHQVAKTTTAVTLGGSLMVLSGLTLAATVIGLVLATPLLVIFSPVLVPAAITLFLILAGFVTSGGFGAIASFVFYWMYKYATGKHPIGADQLDRARDKLAHAAYDVKERAEQFGQQHVKGSQGA